MGKGSESTALSQDLIQVSALKKNGEPFLQDLQVEVAPKQVKQSAVQILQIWPVTVGVTGSGI